MAVTSPAEELMAPLVNTIGFGVTKLVRLKKLKHSALNCNLSLSDTALSLESDKSRSAKPGPFNVPLPRFP